MSDKIVILGAGLAGLSTAYHLGKTGADYLVFEKEDEAGGLCRSKKIDGFTFDYDGHLLHFKYSDIFKLIRDLLKDNLARHKRDAWIYSFNRYTPYPFQANLYGLPPSVIQDCLLGFIKAYDGQPKNENPSFLHWINQTFGEGIAKHFMIPYNRKFWKLPLQGLTCEWIGNYIPVPTLNEVVEGALEKSKINLGYNTHFWYPRKGGIQELALAFARGIKNIHTSHKAVKISVNNRQIHFSNARRERFDILVSTLPLIELINIIDEVPEDISSIAKQLNWVSVLNLNLGINKPNAPNRHWIYFPEKKYVFYRVGFPHNFSKFSAPQKKSSLYVEVSYLPSKRIDKNRLVSNIIKDLIASGIISKKEDIIAKDINDIKYGYIIYDRNHRFTTEKILNFLAAHNIYSIGRYGSWRYMTMEDTVLAGKITAKNIIKSDV